MKRKRLNEKGHCDFCLKRPIRYKRQSAFFCTKCHAWFSFDTGIEILDPRAFDPDAARKWPGIDWTKEAEMEKAREAKWEMETS